MPKSTVFFWGGREGFLTSGKVNGAKIDRFFFFLGGGRGGGVLDMREGQRCQNRPFFFFWGGKINEKSVPKSTVFSGGRGSDLRVAYTKSEISGQGSGVSDGRASAQNQKNENGHLLPSVFFFCFSQEYHSYLKIRFLSTLSFNPKIEFSIQKEASVSY